MADAVHRIGKAFVADLLGDTDMPSVELALVGARHGGRLAEVIQHIEKLVYPRAVAGGVSAWIIGWYSLGTNKDRIVVKAVECPWCAGLQRTGQKDAHGVLQPLEGVSRDILYTLGDDAVGLEEDRATGPVLIQHLAHDHHALGLLGEPCGMVEGLFAHIRKLARKDHLAEVLAAVEGVPLDAGDAVGKGELLQRVDIGKSHSANHLRIVGDNGCAAGSYQTVGGRLEDGIAVGAAIEIGVVGRYNDLLQHVAAAERIRLDALDGARDIDTAKFLAVGKGTAVDEL